MPSSRDPHTRKSFRLLTLGGAALVGGTGVVVAEQRRRLALLVLLASGGEGGVSRDKLIAALSPESPTDSARHALHQLLYYLRQQVGDDAFLGTDPLRLNRDIVGFDVTDFEAALDGGALEDAVAIYRGPFLDGFHLGDSNEFEEWAAGERGRLAARHAEALTRLAEAAAARGDEAAACSWWRRLTELDPLSGRAALGLVRSLAAAGDRAGAVRHARLHESLVRAEIGGEPEPGLAALVAQLQRVDNRMAPPATPFVPALEAAAGPPSSSPSPLVRRGLLGVAAALLVALVGAGVSLRDRPAVEGARDADLLAVTPFEVLEPSLEVWREGMSDRAFAHARRCRPDPHRVAQRGTPALERSRRPGLRRGAGPPHGSGVGPLRRGGAARAGLGDAPRRRARPCRRNGKDGHRGVGGGRPHRRAG